MVAMYDIEPNNSFVYQYAEYVREQSNQHLADIANNIEKNTGMGILTCGVSA